MCRDAQDEETKTAPLQSTGDNLLVADCTNESGVIADYLDDETFGKVLNLPNLASRNSSPKVKKSPLELSPENFFMTSNEMNGECKNPMKLVIKTNKNHKLAIARSSNYGLEHQNTNHFPARTLSVAAFSPIRTASQSEFLLGDANFSHQRSN